MNVTKINTRFLAGNLVSDEYGLNLTASASNYAAQLDTAIRSAFPAADVDVSYENASGYMSNLLQVEFDVDCTEDGWDPALERRVTEEIESIADSVYQDYSWLEEEEEEEEV